MYRTQIYLDRDQMKLLKELAAKQGASLSELIREAIWKLLSQHQKPKKDPLEGIVALYENNQDSQSSLNHDDIYE